MNVIVNVRFSILSPSPVNRVLISHDSSRQFSSAPRYSFQIPIVVSRNRKSRGKRGRGGGGEAEE